MGREQTFPIRARMSAYPTVTPKPDSQETAQLMP